MEVKNLVVIAAMEQEALAVFPGAQKKSFGRFDMMAGTLANGVSFRCIVSGIGIKRAAEAAAAVCAEKPDLLLSIGVSGGLVPGLCAGTTVTATSIVSDISDIPSWRENAADEAAREALLPACGEFACGPLVTVQSPVLTPDEKQTLYERTGALAADMESVVVANTAVAAGIPFACIRAISDDWSRAVPSEAMEGVDEEGRTRIRPILKALLKRPGLVFELIPMGRDYSKALKALGSIF
ncbi:phosphorylase [Maridesulfovibrio sp.]|uniref:phosphorylase family protein n=1 Tax=Maridesulfovibrio sp. TaxID=2795000 RepID=UPI002A18B9CB|nr:phosphorylase [Maridesulfovibrio sp.]